jgi:hypothetical protein
VFDTICLGEGGANHLDTNTISPVYTNTNAGRSPRRAALLVSNPGRVKARTLLKAVAPAAVVMTSQGTPHGRFQRAIRARQLFHAELAARELGSLTLADALALTALIAKEDPAALQSR